MDLRPINRGDRVAQIQHRNDRSAENKRAVEGAKFTGEKFKDAGKAGAPPAKSTWENVKDGTSSVGYTVKKFFTGLFSN